MRRSGPPPPPPPPSSSNPAPRVGLSRPGPVTGAPGGESVAAAALGGAPGGAGLGAAGLGGAPGGGTLGAAPGGGSLAAAGLGGAPGLGGACLAAAGLGGACLAAAGLGGAHGMGGASLAAAGLGGAAGLDGASRAAGGLGDADGLDAVIGDEFLMASQASSTPVAQARRRAASANKRARDDEGDHMDWNDGYTTLICKLFVEQVRKGNRPNTHLNNVGYSEVKERFFQSTGIMLKKSQLKNKWDKLRGDLSAWKKLMRKQTGTGWNWEKGTINMDAEWWKKTKKDIPGVGKFKNRPLQNEDELKVMFGNIINEEQDHWNPMSSNPIIPPSEEAPNPMSSNFIDAEDGLEMGGNNDLDNGDEVQEVSPSVANAKKKVHVILDKPNKKSKASTALVIQEHISKISDNASSFVASRQAGITIEQVMDHVAACGAACGSDEHFVATELFVKKELREMFMTIPTNEARFSWLKRKCDMMFAK